MNAISPAQLEMYKQFNRVLSLNEENDERAINENKEVDALLLAIDKFFYWNPYMDLRGEETLGECNWATDVWTKYSWTPSGEHITHSINPSFIVYSIRQ